MCEIIPYTRTIITITSRANYNISRTNKLCDKGLTGCLRTLCGYNEFYSRCKLSSPFFILFITRTSHQIKSVLSEVNLYSSNYMGLLNVWHDIDLLFFVGGAGAIRLCCVRKGACKLCSSFFLFFSLFALSFV